MTLNRRSLLIATGIGLAVFFGAIDTGFAADRQVVQGNVPAVVSQLQPLGRLPAASSLNLTIGLPLRNEQALDDLLREIYDPASPNFHHYLTPEQFAEQFGPTKQDYQAVIDFAEANGLKVTGTQPNRVVLDVSGSVADIERVFQVTLQTYRHPQEARDFYAPDAEPSVDLGVPIIQISGLNNYSLPHPSLKVEPVNPAGGVTPNLGSGPAGSYMGNDFRAAYVPGTSLTGSGQSVALVQFDGYASNNIAAYIRQAGLTNYPIVLTNVPIVGTVPVPPGAGNGEVCLDIEMVIAMAPGNARIIVYEATNNGTVSWSTMLSRIANDNLAKQIGCSWSGGAPDAAANGIFKQMASQGQSFYCASGDSDAFIGPPPFLLDNTNITLVGGTVLNTAGPGGSYIIETVWNDSGFGSSGGISTLNAIPVWQQGINMTTNKGSTTLRNMPDVALTAKNVFIIADNQQLEIASGTSCAAPLWAGFTALVNQQAVAAGRPTVGFVNPAIYAIGKGASYNADFHDITIGNNTWSASPTKFFATNGYDLCTGWGTPRGTNLINALAGLPEPLTITPATGFTAFGGPGGAFTITSQIFTLTNAGGSSLNWQIGSTSSWLNVSSTSGTLPGAGQSTVTIGLNTAASNLVLGTYAANVWFTNRTTTNVQGRQFTLHVVEPLSITPTNGFITTGPAGGPFNFTALNLSLTNIGAGSVSWSLANTSLWLDVSPLSGTLVGNGAAATVAVSLNSTANRRDVGVYPASLCFTNPGTHSVQYVPFVLQVGQSVIQNGGFEAGNFSFWNVAGDSLARVDNGAVSGMTPHTGSYLAALAASVSLGTLSQTLATVANQSYVLSVWLNSPNAYLASGGQALTNIPNEFSVSWNGSLLFDQINLGQVGWTNLQFIVTATGASTVLQFGEQDVPWYLGVDDVTLVPVPTPSFRSVAKISSSNAIAFSWNSMSNFVYQVQYSTNLATTNWFILSTNTATGPILTVTNGYGTDPRRFYRIRRLP